MHSNEIHYSDWITGLLVRHAAARLCVWVCVRFCNRVEYVATRLLRDCNRVDCLFHVLGFQVCSLFGNYRLAVLTEGIIEGGVGQLSDSCFRVSALCTTWPTWVIQRVWVIVQAASSTRKQETSLTDWGAPLRALNSRGQHSKIF